MIVQILVLAFCGLMVFAAISDTIRYIIPNWIPAAIALLFPLAAFAAGFGWALTGMHLLAGFTALLIGMALFASGAVGGGDAKLFAAASLWFGWPGAGVFLAYSALAGGVLALILILGRRIAPATPLPAGWIEKSPFKQGAPAPYGVALAAGALWALTYSIWTVI